MKFFLKICFSMDLEEMVWTGFSVLKKTQAYKKNIGIKIQCSDKFSPDEYEYVQFQAFDMFLPKISFYRNLVPQAHIGMIISPRSCFKMFQFCNKFENLPLVNNT